MKEDASSSKQKPSAVSTVKSDDVTSNRLRYTGIVICRNRTHTYTDRQRHTQADRQTHRHNAGAAEILAT